VRRIISWGILSQGDTAKALESVQKYSESGKTRNRLKKLTHILTNLKTNV
jgi:hypothetical protein